MRVIQSPFRWGDRDMRGWRATFSTLCTYRNQGSSSKDSSCCADSEKKNAHKYSGGCVLNSVPTLTRLFAFSRVNTKLSRVANRWLWSLFLFCFPVHGRSGLIAWEVLSRKCGRPLAFPPLAKPSASTAAVPAHPASTRGVS